MCPCVGDAVTGSAGDGGGCEWVSGPASRFLKQFAGESNTIRGTPVERLTKFSAFKQFVLKFTILV